MQHAIVLVWLQRNCGTNALFYAIKVTFGRYFRRTMLKEEADEKGKVNRKKRKTGLGNAE